MLPSKLTHGDNLANLFEKFNTVVDYLRETRLVAGPGMRINRHPAGTTIESTATASGGVSAPNGDQWNITAIESENYIDLTVHVRRAEDNNYTLMFRGKPYYIQDQTFRISRSDLETYGIYFVIVKRITSSQIDFTLAMTRVGAASMINFSTGIFSLGNVGLLNGSVTTVLYRKSMIEWEDPYFGNGLFTADLGYTNIPDQGSSFSDFLDSATQVLAVSQRFPLCINNTVINQTGSGSVYTLFDVSPGQIGDKAQRLYWRTEYGPSGNSDVPVPFNYRFELKQVDTNHPDPAPVGFIRIPVAYISIPQPIRKNARNIINAEYLPSNFPMLYINPIGKDLVPQRNGFLYLDLADEKLRCSISCRLNGITRKSITLSVSFSSFSSISTFAYLRAKIKYNYGSKTWSDPWCELDGSPLTPVPEFSGTEYTRDIAVLSYNSETERPVILAQNFTAEIDFTSESQFFTDFESRIYALENDVSSLKIRVTNLENR